MGLNHKKEAIMASKEEKKVQPLPEGNEAKEITVRESALPILPLPEVLREVFEKNFEGITPTFEIVKVPTGGGVAWTLAGEEDEQEHGQRRRPDGDLQEVLGRRAPILSLEGGRLRRGRGLLREEARRED